MTKDFDINRVCRGFGGRFAGMASVVMALVVTGCVHTERPISEESSASTPPPASQQTSFQVAPAIEGKVVSVRSDLRYTVVDFSFSRMPKPGVEMAAYREGRAIGRLRISKNPSHANRGAVVADILSGDIREGDQVRFE